MTNKSNSINKLSQSSVLWNDAVILLVSAASQGAVGNGPRTQPPTAEASRGDLPAERTRTPREIEQEATDVRHNASTLQMPARFRDSSRLTRTWELPEASESITRISERMCRLQGNRRVAEPWRQQSLYRDAAELNAARGSAERAIAAFGGPRVREELHGATRGRSLDELSRAVRAMRRASQAEQAQEFSAFYLNPINVTPLPVSPTPGDQ